jgi:hypothetical protein
MFTKHKDLLPKNSIIPILIMKMQANIQIVGGRFLGSCVPYNTLFLGMLKSFDTNLATVV